MYEMNELMLKLYLRIKFTHSQVKNLNQALILYEKKKQILFALIENLLEIFCINYYKSIIRNNNYSKRHRHFHIIIIEYSNNPFSITTFIDNRTFRFKIIWLFLKY